MITAERERIIKYLEDIQAALKPLFDAMGLNGPYNQGKSQKYKDIISTMAEGMQSTRDISDLLECYGIYSDEVHP